VRFFICYAPCPHLNAVNTVFAQVIGGLETLEAMERAEVDSRSRPLRPISIASCRIHANPFAEQSNAA
jgi:peptidyl-prolyl cis-trans isomerase-like 3